MSGLLIAGILILGLFVVLGIIRANLFICQPNEVLIFSGRKRRLADGSDVGYRVIRGGRGFRVPIFEKVDRLDLTTIPIDLTVQNAYSKGGIPLQVRAIANVKVASTENELNNAVERMLGKRREEVMMIAKETLEGNLRGVLALLTPEEVNEDRLKFAKELLDEADNDLSALGLQLDTLKIQSMDDERGYLNAIGRQQTAQVVASAEIAEAQRMEQARTAQAHANKAIAEAENEVRIVRAELLATSQAAEARAGVAGQLAQAEAEQALAEQQILLSQKRQRADIVVKAEAEREASEERAKGDAARVYENGKAEVEILRQKLALWQEAGPEAERLFLLQMLPDIMRDVLKTVDGIKIDKLTVVDNGSGTGDPERDDADRRLDARPPGEPQGLDGRGHRRPPPGPPRAHRWPKGGVSAPRRHP